MTESSSLYVTCPGCAKTTLILRAGPGVRCADCGFDYVTFDHQRCHITQIQPIDYARMKADGKAN